jgi:hypothetical protein
MPPLPHYALLATNERAVGDAMRKVAFERTVGDAEYCFEDWRIAGVDQQRALRSWLSTLGGRETSRACGIEFEKTVAWAGKQSLRWVVQDMQGEARRRFAAMARELQRLRLLQGEEVSRLSPRFDLCLLDYRGDTRQPLPQKEWLLGDSR